MTKFFCTLDQPLFEIKSVVGLPAHHRDNQLSGISLLACIWPHCLLFPPDDHYPVCSVAILCMCNGIKIQLFFVVYSSALRFLNTDSVAMWLRPPFAVPLRESFLDHCRHKIGSNTSTGPVSDFFARPAGRRALTSFDSEPRVKSDNSVHASNVGARIRLLTLWRTT